jgi:hypothetical protein
VLSKSRVWFLKLRPGNVLSNVDPSVQHVYNPLIPWVKKQLDEIDMFESDPTQKDLTMNAERRQRLLGLGLVSLWEEKFGLLSQYREEHGHCKYRNWNVCHVDVKVPSNTTRLFSQTSPGNLSGKTNVTEKYKSLPPWVKRQRESISIFDKKYPSSNKPGVTGERRQRFLDLGFVLDLASREWEEGFELLRQYKDEFGHCKLAY